VPPKAAIQKARDARKASARAETDSLNRARARSRRDQAVRRNPPPVWKTEDGKSVHSSDAEWSDTDGESDAKSSVVDDKSETKSSTSSDSATRHLRKPGPWAKGLGPVESCRLPKGAPPASAYTTYRWELPSEVQKASTSAKRKKNDVNNKVTRPPIGKFWYFNLMPLSMKEERSVISRRRWQRIPQELGKSGCVSTGDYKVAPDRYDIQNFQRKFWMSREIHSLLVMISRSPYTASSIEVLLDLRRHVLSYLGNGTAKTTSDQRSLLSSIYYCLRQCNRLTVAGKL
jgi:hypothetical protein